MTTRILTSALAALAASSVANAATITWGTATNVTADTDVSTLGTLVQAFNMGLSTSETINGVNFVGNTTGIGSMSNPYAAYGAPAGLSANYSTALGSGVYQTGGGVLFSGSLTGLTVGDTYQFEVWFNDQRNASVSMQFDSGASTPTVTLNGGSSGSPQYSTGVFTANAANQTFRIQPAAIEGATLNMYELRDITAVPEPSTYGLLGAGTLAALSFARRRRRA